MASYIHLQQIPTNIGLLLILATSGLITPKGHAQPKKAAQSSELNGARIARLTGLKGEYDAQEHVFKVSLPRKDLDIRTAGVRLTPALGLTAWGSVCSRGRTHDGDG